jgi:hypothetical protein
VALGAVAVVAVGLAALGLRGGGPGAERDGDAYVVSPAGSDVNPGTEARPWRTVSAAVERLRPGDTLLVREGTYFERPDITVSGTAAAPITIQSYPGERAVIDSGADEPQTAGNQAWELVDAELGEYRTVAEHPPGNVYGYVDGIPGYVNGRVGLVPYGSGEAFRATGDAYVDDQTPFYVGPGTFADPSDRRIHIRLAKTPDLRAAEARYGAVFEGDLPDPRRHRIILSRAPATLTVAGAHLVLKDLTVHQAKDTIRLTSGAHHVRFEGITAWTGDTAIKADGSDVTDVTVTRSRIYGDHPRWVFWSDMKSPPAPADLMRSTAIDLYGGTSDWEISHNHLRGSGQDLISTNTGEDRISIHHNRMENCGDDALELEGTEDVGEVRVFENYIVNCLVAVAAGQDSPSFTGPLYVFRNVVAFLRDFPANRAEGINEWNGGGRFGFEYLFKQHSGNVFIYHNTLVLLNSGGDGINLVPESPAGTYVANNLAVVVNGRVNGPYPTGPGQLVDGNLYWSLNPGQDGTLLSDYPTVPAFAAATGLERDGLGEAAGRGTDPRFAGFRPEVADRSQERWELRPRSEALEPSAFLLAGDSPAIGAGIAIPRHPRLGSLPDTRSSRDIGALPHDASPAELAAFPFDPAAATQ